MQNHPTHPAPHFMLEAQCASADGTPRWRERVRNLVTAAGKTDLISTYFTAAGYTANWYLGLMGSGAISANDTLAAHPGWQEIATASGLRPAITFGATLTGSNSANAVNCVMAGTAIVAGAFITSAGSGSGGILYSLASFSALRSVISGDILTITPTVMME